jgi:hypothetical protein
VACKAELGRGEVLAGPPVSCWRCMYLPLELLSTVPWKTGGLVRGELTLQVPAQGLKSHPGPPSGPSQLTSPLTTSLLHCDLLGEPWWACRKQIGEQSSGCLSPSGERTQ